jgi:TonB family protein
MSSLQSWFLASLLNSLWQLPLIFAAACIAARLVRPLGPRIEHRVWVAALIAGIVLPACTLDPIHLGRSAWALVSFAFGANPGNGHVQVIVGPATLRGTGFFRLPPYLLAVLLAVYISGLLYFAIRLGWGLWKTRCMSLEARTLSPGSILAKKLEGQIANCHPVQIAVSSAIPGPVTIGLRRHILLVPPGFLDNLEEADLNALLAHEFAHIRRLDFAKNLFYELLSLPIAFHPILRLTRSHLSETREMACDELAAEAVAGRETYARSLLRLASMLASPLPATPLHAIGIFDANIFERRVMNLTQPRPIISASRRAAIAAVCAVVALTACASAMALRLEVAQAQTPAQNPKSIHVKYDDLKLTTEVQPVYPPKARAAGISGSVVLDATISKEGVPENLKVVKGPRDLQSSALDAVRQWRWQPYLLNGDPIEVKTTVTVVYSLPN